MRGRHTEGETDRAERTGRRGERGRRTGRQWREEEREEGGWRNGQGREMDAASQLRTDR